MFWGLIMEPNKRYTQVVEKPFHISQAAMDISTGDNEPCQVMVVVDGKNFLICTLQKTKNIQVPLDLYFKSGNSISFLTNGKCNVHLTGYLDPEFEEELSDEDDDEDEEEEEVPVPVTKNKRKLENANDMTASKKAKPEKKGKKATAVAVAVSGSDSEEDEDDDRLQKLLDGDDIDTDDNDESFNVNISADVSDSDEEESDEEEEDEEEEKEESTEEAETTLDTSKEESNIDVSKLSKSQRRRLNKKLQQQKGKTQPQVNGVDKTNKKEKQENQQKVEKKKPEAKETQEGQAAEKKEKKSLSGGVMIEDLKVGNGPVAKSGKTVMVYYEGRLKQNNKMFDNCIKGPGFKFRLGAKEVISGWDIGINGMKVGGKRKIVCPPAMAYGAKGSPPVIPPNSTLVFEVELKHVK